MGILIPETITTQNQKRKRNHERFGEELMTFDSILLS